MRLPSPPDVCVYSYGRLKWPARVRAPLDGLLLSVGLEAAFVAAAIVAALA